jgi:uncharacterized membrane protein
MEIHVTNLKPTVGSVYGHAWDTMKKYFLPLFLLLLITGIISAPAGLLDNKPMVSPNNLHEIGDWKIFIHNHSMGNPAGHILYKIFVLFYTLFIINPISYGAKYVRLKAIRNLNFDVKEVFDVFKNYLNVILAAILASSIIVIGFFFLIIPGIILACRLAFVPYLVMDKKLDPVKAVEESWRLTRGYGWRIFWMAILAFFIGIAGFICLIFGLIFSIIWISLAFAAMYQAVIQERGEYNTANLETITETGS